MLTRAPRRSMLCPRRRSISLPVGRLLILAASLWVLSPNRSGAQAIKLEPGARNERNVVTDDDWQIYLTYYASKAERESEAKESPVVVLLHGDKDNRLSWGGSKGGLAVQLQGQGYAVITVDLRKHGQSTNVGRIAGDSPAGGKNADGGSVTAMDYRGMVEFDLESVKRFIYEEHQRKHLNMNKMAVIAAESSAAVALCFAVNDWEKEPYEDAPSPEQRTRRGQDVRALVLLSPPQRVKGLPTSEALSLIRNPDWNVGVLIMYGERNKADAKDAAAVFKRLTGSSKTKSDRLFLVGYNANVRGCDLLGKKELDAEATIIKFLKLRLSSLPGEWRDRQNRLSKK